MLPLLCSQLFEKSLGTSVHGYYGKTRLRKTKALVFQTASGLIGPNPGQFFAYLLQCFVNPFQQVGDCVKKSHHPQEPEKRDGLKELAHEDDGILMARKAKAPAETGAE
jgi:hypothetical protein